MDIIAVLMQCTVFVLLSFSKYANHKIDPNLTGSQVSEAARLLTPNATLDAGGGGGGGGMAGGPEGNGVSEPKLITSMHS